MMALGLGMGIEKVRSGDEGSSYSPDAQAYFDRLVNDISAERKDAINTFISDFLSDNSLDTLDQAFDYFYLLGGVEAQANANLNLISSSFTITPINAPTWATNGYTGNGATSYLKTGFIDSSHAVVFQQNDGFLGVFCRTNGSATASIELGNFSDSGSYYSTYISPSYSLTDFRLTVNEVSNPFTTYANTDGRGLFVATRSGATKRGYINGSLVITENNPSSGLPTEENYILCSNYLNGIPLRFSNKQAVVAFKGKASVVNQALLHTRLDTLMTALGCNI